MAAAVQVVLAQSLPSRQLCRSTQRCAGAHDPPQSTSVSLPFRIPSEQVGAEHLEAAAGQIPLAQSAARAQVLPVPHGGQLPPQSRSVSAPFLTRSSQLGWAHTPLVHTPLAQSAPMRHPPPPGQRTGQAPPQSRSVSLPFGTPSPQVAARHSAPVHTRLAQSAETAHPLPSPQETQDPPQSRSVSEPFSSPSPQPESWQIPLVQTLSTQLPSEAPHPFPVAHRRAHDPPQSVSVSSPFFTPSSQVATAQARFAAHTRVVQSPPVPQPRPTAQRCEGAHAPPQSTSVSEPFRAPSLQDATWHTPAGPAPHTAFAQSPPERQPLPFAQRGQPTPPPQSVSDSSPFLIPSLQLGFWHSPPMQFPPPQSMVTTQVRPGPQRGHPEVAPPQSTSDSSPLRMKSPQVAIAQARSTQEVLAQSPPAAQRRPTAQAGQEPPQSTSDSVPLRR